MTDFPLIDVDHLCRGFKTGNKRSEVLQDLSLRVNRGEFVAIMGASGSGKSTLLNVLGGLLSPDEGAVTVAGLDLGRLNDKALTEYRRDKVGIIFQMFNLVETLTVEENIQLPAMAGGRQVPQEVLDRLIEQVGLTHRRKAMPATLSGGEKQRTAIARALASGSELVLADEPTGNLDSVNTRQIGDLFKTLHAEHGCAFLLVTHAPDVAMWADRIVIIKDGRIRADRAASDFRDPAELSAFYEHALESES